MRGEVLVKKLPTIMCLWVYKVPIIRGAVVTGKMPGIDTRTGDLIAECASNSREITSETSGRHVVVVRGRVVTMQ